MPVSFPIKGLHHVTATTDAAGPDFYFYTSILGLRLVKQTVNFDDPKVYHLYYGDREGNPGSIMTTFPYQGHGVRKGIAGTGQVACTAFSVPAGALSFWMKRLQSHRIPYERRDVFGEDRIHFMDPAGLQLALVTASEEERTPWTAAGIATEVAIRGLHSVQLSLNGLSPSLQFLEEEFAAKQLSAEGHIIRLALEEGFPGQLIDLIDHTGLERAHGGWGTVHHVAFQVADLEALQAYRKRLREDLKFNVTEIKDRKYFQSIYFRMPGKVLFEIATRVPGFNRDEAMEHLGEKLMLPDWAEPERTKIMQQLPPLRGIGQT